MSAVAVIGNLSRDVVAGATPRPGGAVYYAARALARIGAQAHIVARCAAADVESLLLPLESFGIPVTLRAGERTTAFTFHYEGDHRVMNVDEVGDPWTVEDANGWVAEAIGESEWVQVGALLRTDFTAPTLAALATGRRLLVDAQGLVRLASVGPLERDADVDPAALRSLAVLKLNEDEARILAGGVEPDLLRALGIPEIVLTLGSAGALLVTTSGSERIEQVPVEGVVDPTGAGDAFSAAYVSARAQGATPVEAARAANALAAELVSAS
ncbi:MAG: PfkB family carbohydrate kinase [Thermoleophilia bacterium]|nr:PfkB family carbohydrate kinase [Thermoleophilia bacterium]